MFVTRKWHLIRLGVEAALSQDYLKANYVLLTGSRASKLAFWTVLSRKKGENPPFEADLGLI